jgi:hypothetical protein
MGKPLREALPISGFLIVFFSSLCFLFLDSLYCGKINSHAEMSLKATIGRPGRFYDAALSLLILSTFQLVLVFPYFVYYLAGGHDGFVHWIATVLQGLFFLGQLVAASVGIHEASQGELGWDDSDGFNSKDYGPIRDYVNWHRVSRVIHVTNFNATATGILDPSDIESSCLNLLFPRPYLEVLGHLPDRATTRGNGWDWGFGEFVVYSPARVPLAADFPLDWNPVSPELSYNPFHERSELPACFGLLVDQESVGVAFSDLDACELRFKGETAVCAPGWDLDALAQRVFCEPFEKCLEALTDVDRAFGQSSFTTPSGFTEEEQDAYLSVAKREFTFQQYTSAMTFHIGHGILLAFLIIGEVFASIRLLLGNWELDLSP